MTNEDRRIVRTRSNLKKAMLELLTTHDFKEISITKIAETAHCNRVTFYSHYESSSQLLTDIFHDYLIELAQHFRGSFEGKKTFSLADPSRSIPVFDFVYRNQYVFTLMLKGEVVPGSQNLFCDTISSISRSDLELSEDIGFDIEAVNYYETYALLGLFIYWIKEGFKSAPGEMAERISYLYSNTLGEVVVKNNSSSKS